MARIEFISVVKKGYGRMDDVVLGTNEDQPFMYTYRKREYKGTENQVKVSAAFTKLAGDWKNTYGIIRLSWDQYSKKVKGSGYNAYMGANSVKQRDGQPLLLTKSLGAEKVENFQAAPGSAAGQIVCSFAPVNSGRHVSFFVQEKVGNVAAGPFTRFNGGADCPSPFTITGLKAATEYFVYALVTDDVFDRATVVSESAGALTTAG